VEDGRTYYDLRAHLARGGAGNDIITACNNGIRANGDDTITGSDHAVHGADLLYGGLAGNDTLLGRASHDKLGGGHGLDRTTGGAGRDQFDVRLNDTGVGAGRRDIITDFQRSADDVLLGTIDANTGRGSGLHLHRRQGFHRRWPAQLPLRGRQHDHRRQHRRRQGARARAAADRAPST
jgi:Ca2+-binding RTX toxin-like protein